MCMNLATSMPMLAGLSCFLAEQALYAALYAKRTLGAGFTTVRNVGANDFVDIGLRNAINAGVTEGPRMLTAGHIIGSPGGHADGYSFPPERVHPLGPIEGICSGPEECREATRYQMKWGADVIKFAASGGVLSEADPGDLPQRTRRDVQERFAGRRADRLWHGRGRISARDECNRVRAHGGSRNEPRGGSARRHARVSQASRRREGSGHARARQGRGYRSGPGQRAQRYPRYGAPRFRDAPGAHRAEDGDIDIRPCAEPAG